MLTGYLAGLAIVIVVDQVPKLLGLSVDAEGLIGQIAEIFRELGDANWRAALVGGGVVVLVLGLRRVNERIPGVLIAVVGATIVSAAAGLAEHGVAVVGEVPSGLPSVALPGLSADQIADLLRAPARSP